MNSVFKRLMASLILCACAVGAQDAPPRPSPHPAAARVPAFAFAALRFPNLGQPLDAFAAYCSTIVGNSGALGKLFLSSALFPVSIHPGDGIAQDQPAAVYWIDPARAGRTFEVALSLPVADAARFRAALKEAYGAEGDGEKLSFSIMQGVGQKDRTFVVRLGAGRAWLAPNVELLDALIRHEAAALPAEATDEVALDADLDALRKTYGPVLGQYLAFASFMSQALLPEAAPALAEISRHALPTWEQLGALTLRLRFDGTTACLGGRLHAHAGTALADFWDARAPKMGADLAKLLPAGTPFFAQLPNHDLAFLDLAVREAFRLALKLESPEARKALAVWRQAMAQLAHAAERAASVSLLPAPGGKLRIAMALDTQNPDAAAKALEVYLQAVAAAGGESLRSVLNLPKDAPAPLVLNALPAETHGARSIAGFALDFAPGLPLPEGLRAALARATGWPLTIQIVRTEAGVLAVAGVDALGTARELLDLSAGDPVQSLAGHAVLKDELAALAEGVDLWTRVNLLATAAMLLEAWVPPDTLDFEAITRRLSDAAVRVRLETGGQCAGLEIRAPAESIEALMEAYLRLKRRGIDPLTLLLHARPGGGTVPAPLPPPPDE